MIALDMVLQLLGILATLSVAYAVHRTGKRHATLQALDRLNDLVAERDRRLSGYDELRPGTPITDKVLEWLRGQPEATADIFDLLNAYESLASGVDQGIYDGRVVERLRQDALVGTYFQFRPVIEDRRRNYPSAWRGLEKLALTWHEHGR